MFRWLSLDIATKDTGYAVYEYDEEIRLVKHGVIHINGKYAKDRFPEMVFQMTDLIFEYNPSAIIVEGFYGGKNFSSIEYLAKLQGAIESTCAFGNIWYLSTKASQWRAGCGFVVGKQKSKTEQNKRKDYKTLAKEFASKLAGTDITSEDEADAICIGYGGFVRMISPMLQGGEYNGLSNKRAKKTG